MGMQDSTLESHESLRSSQIVDLRLAASKMTGATRRAFQAEMALKYCGGSFCWSEPSSGGAVILWRWGLPRDARGSYVSGRKRPSAVANRGKTRSQRQRKPSGAWLKHTRNKTQRSAPPWPIRD